MTQPSMMASQCAKTKKQLIADITTTFHIDVQHPVDVKHPMDASFLDNLLLGELLLLSRNLKAIFDHQTIFNFSIKSITGFTIGDYRYTTTIDNKEITISKRNNYI